MTGRALSVWVVLVVLAGRAGAQFSPVPPPASRVTQTSSTDKAPSAQKPSLPDEAEPPVVPPPVLPAPLTPPSWEGSNGWASADALIWWIQGARLPALVTTSPAGTPAARAGVPGNGTEALFGLQNVNTRVSGGGALWLGRWLDPEHRFGAEVGFFLTQPQGTNFPNASPNGNPILARPYVDAITGKPAADPIAVPGVTSGAFFGSYSTSGLVGTSVLFRENFANSRDPFCLCRLCGPGCGDGGCGSGCGDGCCADDNGFRFDGLLGYRFLRMGEHLDVDTDITNLTARPNGPAGTHILTTDQIHTVNIFNGVDIGVNGQVYRGRMYVDMLAKVAFGATSSYVDLFGARTINGVRQPGGGFLVQSSNFGRFNQTAGAVLPEVGLKFGYRFSDHVRVYAGYTLFYWFHVARPGDAIDTGLNPNLLNGGNVAAGALHPVFANNNANIFVQGVTTGIEWRY